MDESAPKSCASASMVEESGLLVQGDMEIVGRAPPRVDSCSDMDTRPPLTPDVAMSMDMDAKQARDLQDNPFHMQELLRDLPSPTEIDSAGSDSGQIQQPAPDYTQGDSEAEPCPLHIAVGFPGRVFPLPSSEPSKEASSSHRLFSRGSDSGHLFTLFQYETDTVVNGSTRAAVTAEDGQPSAVNFIWELEESPSSSELDREASFSSSEESVSLVHLRPLQESKHTTLERHLALAKVPGCCDPDDLLDGVVFGAKYLGSTQLDCERHQMASTYMRQAQEAVDRVKAPDGESQPMTEVDVLVSIHRIKVLNADTQDALMDHPLKTISYAADIGSIVVIMACRKPKHGSDQPSTCKRPNKILCHVFQSEDAHLIAQSIGQAFGLAYQDFLQSEGVEVTQAESTHITELYNADLDHFTKKESCKEVFIRKQQGEVLGIAIVESGWGSLLPTVVIANIMHGGPAERSGELSIGDHVISVNGTSMVGLPFPTCQGLIRELKSQSEVTLSIVRCPPVLTAIMQRPDATYQLGFSVENGVVCSLIRGGIAEKGGIRVGHRIIEINGQSVVAMPHDKIIQTLLDSTGEVHIKTMPASTYRLLTGQEMPNYL